MDVNYFGGLYATKAVLNNMKLAKAGTIAFLSSQGGQVGFIGMTAYSPTKYAVRGLAESLRNEVGVSAVFLLLFYRSPVNLMSFGCSDCSLSSLSTKRQANI